MILPVDIASLYAEGRPFAVCRPGGTDGVIVCDGDSAGFLVSPWLGSYADAVRPSIAAPGPDEPGMPVAGTVREAYIESTQWLIDRLRQRGGKCVRMRTVCGSGRLDINAAVAELFERFPMAFCHCYYTPSTGLWMGATPEILLDCAAGEVRTMALAGTRVASGDAPWDDKNVREQSFVTDFITCVFRDCGLEPEVSEPASLRYGAIEHICNRIRASVPCGFDPAPLIDALSPTPAVAGLPREVALAEIDAVEDAPRSCYAGWVALREAGRLRAFVNLRCARLSADGWCVYAGGGITADSDAAAEWSETEAKAAPLCDILISNTLSL